MFPGFSALSRHSTPSGAVRNQPQAPADPEKWIKNLIAAERACCCSAKPTTAAVLPARPGRAEPVDLLLCNHHYQETKASLAAAGAEIHRPRW
jgi:hypothetical protein